MRYESDPECSLPLDYLTTLTREFVHPNNKVKVIISKKCVKHQLKISAVI